MGDINQSFDYIPTKIISRLTSIHEMNFLDAFHIHKNLKNNGNLEFAIPPLSDYLKYYIKFFCL